MFFEKLGVGDASRVFVCLSLNIPSDDERTQGTYFLLTLDPFHHKKILYYGQGRRSQVSKTSRSSTSSTNTKETSTNRNCKFII
jgi:hypothetical protein